MSARNRLISVVGVAVAMMLLQFTPSWEGRMYSTYYDIGGVLSYCDGATENPVPGKRYTDEECDEQTARDLARHAEGIKGCLPWDRLTDGQRVAFVDAAYNIGVRAFCNSSMARRAREGDILGACAALSMWDKVGGKPVRGLTRRRAAERALCEGVPLG